MHNWLRTSLRKWCINLVIIIIIIIINISLSLLIIIITISSSIIIIMISWHNLHGVDKLYGEMDHVMPHYLFIILHISWFQILILVTKSAWHDTMYDTI